MKKQFFYSIILLSCLILISCGLSAEDKHRAEILFGDEADSVLRFTPTCNLTRFLDSVQQFQQKKPEVTSVKKEIQFYYASDFNLPTGKVVCFSPNSDWINDNSENGIVSEQIYIHIEDENGGIRVFPVDYKTWLALGSGTRNIILK